MREIRIYQPGHYLSGQSLELSPEASQHVGVVLRMQPGENIILFSGNNREFIATIETVKKKQVIVTLGLVKDVSRESPLMVHLAQAISKGDRMDLVMQKTVELGVASITPIISERSFFKLNAERMKKKLHQWQAIVVAACEQSGRNQIPVVHQPTPLEHYVQKIQVSLKLVLHPDGPKRWRDYDLNQSSIGLLIGPEGGLCDEEVQLACDYGFQILSLGSRILRTETAAITALSLLQAIGGDL